MKVVFFLKISLIFKIVCCFFIFVNKNFVNKGAYISKSKRCCNAKPSVFYFYMMTKIPLDFCICISVPLRKSCKLAYQKKRLDDQKKKEARVESEKDLKRKHMTDEIENVKRQKMALEKGVETLRKNLVSETIASDGNQDHAVKAASFGKTLAKKESMLKDLNLALEKLEENFKLLK